MRNYEITKNIRSISNLVNRRIDESEQLQKVNRITDTNGRIMSFLARNQDKEIFQRDIEKEMTITRSTVSRVLSLMEEKGLIERHPVSYDTRLKRLVLTKKALKMHAAIITHLENVENQLLNGFSKAEIKVLQSFLLRMKSNLDE